MNPERATVPKPWSEERKGGGREEEKEKLRV